MWTVARQVGQPVAHRKETATATLVLPSVTRRFNAMQTRYFAVTKHEALTKRSRTFASELEDATMRLLDKTTNWTLADWRASDKVLNSWTLQPKVSQNSIRWSFRLLERMAQESKQSSKTSFFTIRHVNRVIDWWRIGARTIGLLDPNLWSASRVLEKVESYAENVANLNLNTKTYSMIMDAYIRQFPSRSSSFCLDIVHRMMKTPSAPPNVVALTYLMEAHVQGGLPNAVFATQSLFDYLVEKSQDDPNMVPTEKSLSLVLQARVSLDAPNTTVEEALVHMKRNIRFMVETSQRNRKVLPNAFFLNHVLGHCSKRSKNGHSILRADALLTHIMEVAVDHPHLLPDAKTLSRMVFLWANSGMVSAPRQAEHWLDEMCRLRKQVTNFDSPRYTVYAATIAAWGKSELPEAPCHAERIWHRMIQDTSVATIGAAKTIISLWAQTGEPGRAEQILRELILAAENDADLLPPTSSFVDVIQAWKHGEKVKNIAANNAHAILEILLQYKRLYPDRYMNDLDEVPFQVCLNLWAQSGLAEADSRVDAILEWTKQEEINLSYTTLWIAIPFLSPRKATELLTRISPRSRLSADNPSEQGALIEKVLQLWSKSPDPTAGKCAEQLLEQYFALPKTGQNRERTLACFDHVVGAWQHSSSPDSTGYMEVLLDRMSDTAMDSFQTTGNPCVLAKLAQTYARSGLHDSAKRTRNYLAQALDRCYLQGDKIPSSWYEGVITAFVECGNVSEAGVYLERAQKDKVTITSNMYIPLIKALASHASELDKATTLLGELVSRFIDGSEQARPTAALFGLLIGAHARQRNTEQVQLVWELLQRVLRHVPTDENFQADSSSLSFLAGDTSILHYLLGEPLLRNSGISLDEGMIQCVMEALAKSGHPQSGRRAEGILLKMQELYEEGDLSMEPTFDTFQKVIDAWVNSKEAGFAARANDVLTLAERLSYDGKDKLRPDHHGFLSVISAWSKSNEPNAPEQILKLIGKMKKRFDRGEPQFALTGDVFKALIEAYANADIPEAAKLAKGVFDAAPEKFKDTELYNALIGAQGGDAISAESIFQDMHQGYVDGNEKVQPNTESFNQVLLAWSRSGSPMAAWRVDGLFNRMIGLQSCGQLSVQPNARTFDIIIWTLANKLGADGALKVERYLEMLKEYYRSGHQDCVPSATSYTEAIRVWGSNVDDPRSILRAKALLDEMHEFAREGIKGVQPDRNTYSVYLAALAISTAERKAEIAQDIASMMKSDGVRPDGQLLEHLQRCLLPRTAVLASWDVFPNEQYTKDESIDL